MRFRETAALATFAACMVGTGLVLIRAVPPFAGFDEPYHWYRSLQISRGVLLAPQLGPNDWGGAIDLQGIKYAYWFAARIEAGAPIEKQSAAAESQALAATGGATYAISFPSSAAFAPTAYAPAALAVLVARSLGAAPLAQNTAGRLAQLLAYTGLVWAAILHLPRGRLAALAVLTMPTALHLATSFSADPVNTGLLAFFVAYCLRLHAGQGGRPGALHATALVGLAALLGTLKLTYCPTTLFLMLSPAERPARGWARWAVVAGALAACCLAAATWTAWYPFVPGPYWHAGGDPKAALAFIRHHPLDTLAGLFFTIADNLGSLWQDMSVRFGGHPQPYHFLAPAPFAWTEIAALAALAAVSGSARSQTRVALLCVLVAVLITGLTVVSFRVAYGPPDMSAVQGIQGRYFIPAVFLLVLGVVYASPLSMPRARALLLGLLLCNHLGVCAYAVLRYAALWR